MTRTSPPQVAFSSGELDPLLHRRFDYQRFQTGLAVCRGFIPLPQGGFTRAPGTLFRGLTKGNQECFLMPFQFAANDAVVLEFTNLKMRVWRYGALVQLLGVPYELVTPYLLGDLPRLKWSQSSDVIRIVDGSKPMQRLARFALNSWTIGDETFNTGPFRVQNGNKSQTLQASDDTGAITLTASSALFAANHVGSLFELRPSDLTGVALWTSNEAAIVVGGRRRYGKNTYELTTKGAADVGNNPPVHSEGSARTDNGPTIWKFLSSDVGVCRITGVVNGTTANAQVLKNIPRGCLTDPTYRWSEGAWSERYGYPSSIEAFDQRLVAAGTPSDPRTVWFSTVGAFRDMTPGVAADEAFAYSIVGDSSVNTILNLKRGKTGLHIFALGEEYSSRSETRGQVIGPTTTTFSHNSSQGASLARPIAPQGNPIFITRDGRRVVEIRYDYQEDANMSRNLNLASQHLGNDAFQQIVWQNAPLPLAWVRRTSGDLAVMIYDPQEEVLGWATLPLAEGVVESMAVTTDGTGTVDILTMCVRRVVNGATVRMIEEQAVFFSLLTGSGSISAACHVFAASEFSPGVATSTFNVPHLIGQTVYAWTDVGEYGPMVVAPDGSVVLDAPVTHAFIGLLDSTHYAETLDIQAATADGNSMGRQKRQHSGVAIGLHRSAQGVLQTVERDLGQSERAGTPVNLIARAVAADLTTAFTGVVRVAAPSGHAKEQAVRIWPKGCAPLTITAITPIIQEAGA